MPRDEAAGLRWTGHPLVDHGIATLVAFAGDERDDVSGPADVSLGDLERFAKFAEDALKTKTVASHASVLFTVNVPYLQPSFKPERRAANARAMLRSHQALADPSGARCMYCGRPAIRAATSTGRVYREVIPMLTGQDVMNFAPAGDHGQAICGQCIVALQALVFGAPSCEGRALVVQADDPSFLVRLVSGWLRDSKRRIHVTDINEKAGTWRAPRTRLIEQLVTLHEKDERAEQASGLTIFHLSNSGQGPGIIVHSLAARIVRFVRAAQGAEYHRAWEHLKRRAWRDEKYRDASEDPTPEQRPFWRNTFYDDLFELPGGAVRFVHSRLLRPQMELLDESQDDSHVPMWMLTELFMEEVLGMGQERIRAIRDLGDLLASEALDHDHRLLRSAVTLRSYAGVRRLLQHSSWGLMALVGPLPGRAAAIKGAASRCSATWRTTTQAWRSTCNHPQDF